MPIRVLPVLLVMLLLPFRASADPLMSLLAGEFSLQSGQNSRAAGHYLDAALASGDPALAERAARIALLAGSEPLTRKATARWRELDPKAEGLLQIEASLALARADVEAAAGILTELLAQGEAGERLAVQALASDEHALASGLVIRALLRREALPETADVWVGMGLVARRHQQSGLSLELAQNAATRFPGQARMRLWLAEEQLRLGSEESARATLEQALAMAPLDAPLRLSAAALLERLGEGARAAKLLAEGPQDDGLIGTRAALLARQELPGALESLYAEAKALDGEPPASRRLLLAQLAELAELDGEALDWYRSVHEEPQRSRAQLRVAVLVERAGKLDEALSVLRALQLEEYADGEAVRDAYLLEAELMLRRQRELDALSAYQRGLQVFDEDPRLLYGRALVFERLDRVDEAVEDLTVLLEQDPDNPDHLNALGYTLVDRTDRLEEGLALIEMALEQRPDSAAVIDSHGWALYRLGRLDEALVELRRAFAMQPDAEIAAHLGEVLWVLEQQEEARRVWQQGLEVDAKNRVLLRTIERLGD